jgi:hypothetical protein
MAGREVFTVPVDGCGLAAERWPGGAPVVVRCTRKWGANLQLTPRLDNYANGQPLSVGRATPLRALATCPQDDGRRVEGDDVVLVRWLWRPRVSDDLAALAADACIYGFPLVFDLQAVGGGIDMGLLAPAPFNSFSHASKLAGPEDRFVSINNDTSLNRSPPS